MLKLEKFIFMYLNITKTKMELESLKPDMTLDTRGDMCPMPVMKTSKAIQQVEVGQILEVLATDPASKPDLEAWSKMTGHKLIAVQEEGASPKIYRFYIQRTK